VCDRLILDDEDDEIALIKPNDVVARKLEELSSVHHISIDCCVNSCIAFTASYSTLTQCPFCEEPRFDYRKLSRNTFDYIPIIHRLRLQFTNAARAKILKGYRHKLETETWDEGIRDYWDGRLHQQHKDSGFFNDEHDMALAFSTDGLQ